MNRWIYKKQIKELIKNKSFQSEEEMEEYVISQLPSLLEIKPSQIDKESYTTGFEGYKSERADIIIRTDDYFKKAILVIELKLSRSIDGFEYGDYKNPLNQLQKYCQDTRAPYGILLTDQTCCIFKYRYFKKDPEKERVEEDKLPVIKKIENEMPINSLLDFVSHKKALKYVYLFFAAVMIYFIAIPPMVNFLFSFLKKIF